MKAAVFKAPGQPLSVENVEIASPKKGEALVKIAACGLCHTDLHFIEGEFPWPAPAILGHEASGIVEEIGEGVTLVQPGDHVVLSPTPACGACRYCTSGKPYLCAEGSASHLMRDGTTRLVLSDGSAVFHFLGLSALAEYAVVSEIAMVKVRDDAPLDKLAVVGCAVVTGVGAVLNTAQVRPGSSVAVFGCGGVGLNVVQAAALSGAWPVIAVDRLDSKLATAREFGATHTVNVSQEDPVAAIRELTGGGVDFSFDAVGDIEVLGQAFDSLDRGGKAVMVGLPPLGEMYTLNPVTLFNDKQLQGCAFGSVNIRRDIPMIVDLYMAGRLKLDELVTRAYPLDQVNAGFEAMKKGEVARAIIRF